LSILRTAVQTRIVNEDYVPEAKIWTENLNVYYGRKHVLYDINIRIPPRRITVIMGPSGCGKSTLLKSLNRMIEVVEEAKVIGKVYFNGIDIYDRGVSETWIRKRIGMVFQKPNPLPMSIYDNVAYGPRIHGIKKKRDLDEIVRRELEEVGLWEEVKDRLKDPAVKLSGGQQQRLCIARTLAIEPEVLLLDEPTSSLDPVSACRIEKLLKRLKNKYTVVVVTHDVHQARRIADYVVFLFLGRVMEMGLASELFNNPKDEITRKFIMGEMS